MESHPDYPIHVIYYEDMKEVNLPTHENKLFYISQFHGGIQQKMPHYVKNILNIRK